MRVTQVLLTFVIIAAVPALAGCGARDDGTPDASMPEGFGDIPVPTVVDALVAPAPTRGNEVLEVQANASGAWKAQVPLVVYRRSGTTWQPELVAALKAVEGDATARVVATANGSALEISGTGPARLVATRALSGANESFLRFVLAPIAPVDSDTRVAAYARSLVNDPVAFRVTYAVKTAVCDMTLYAGGLATAEWSAATGEKLANCAD